VIVGDQAMDAGERAYTRNTLGSQLAEVRDYNNCLDAIKKKENNSQTQAYYVSRRLYTAKDFRSRDGSTLDGNRIRVFRLFSFFFLSDPKAIAGLADARYPQAVYGKFEL
jgi:hypothetical protein